MSSDRSVRDIVPPISLRPDPSATYILKYVSLSLSPLPVHLSVIYRRWVSGISLQKPLLFLSSKAHLSVAEN